MNRNPNLVFLPSYNLPNKSNLKMNISSLHVLAYHTICDRINFEEQLLYIKKNYSIISVDQLRQFLFENIKLPKKPLLITLDDGDLSVYDNALPIFKKHNTPAIVFVITDLINTHKPFWWNEIKYYLGSKEGNIKAWEVKNWSNNKREVYLNNLRKSSLKPELKFQQLAISQLQEMQDAGIVIANHSHTHPMYDKCTKEELVKEIELSTFKLREFGFTPDIFAYPNGNYSLMAEEILKKHDITATFLFDHKINKGIINPLRISRLKINDNTPLWKLKLILSGWHSRILPITRTIGKFYRKFT